MWLLTEKENAPGNFIKPNDLLNYHRILYETNAIYHNHDPEKRPKESKWGKWNNIVKPF